AQEGGEDAMTAAQMGRGVRVVSRAWKFRACRLIPNDPFAAQLREDAAVVRTNCHVIKKRHRGGVLAFFAPIEKEVLMEDVSTVRQWSQWLEQYAWEFIHGTRVEAAGPQYGTALLDIVGLIDGWMQRTAEHTAHIAALQTEVAG